MKAYLLFLPLLCLSFNANSQVTKNPTPAPTSGVFIPEAAARRIDATLTKYPLVLKENKHLRTAIRGYEAGAARDSVALVAQDSALVASQRQVRDQLLLRHDANNRTSLWQKKAKKRFWTIVAETIALVAIGFIAAR